ncbi:hypothetical protein ACKC9G_16770 [Pokkaliibacter sp. CJK22405]|uniref:hypothetical protein n=1 Tax=Pokkaliibacter sp. CJK22405 TaxID=3384615 RepID=UPI003984FB60
MTGNTNTSNMSIDMDKDFSEVNPIDAIKELADKVGVSLQDIYNFSTDTLRDFNTVFFDGEIKPDEVIDLKDPGKIKLPKVTPVDPKELICSKPGDYVDLVYFPGIPKKSGGVKSAWFLLNDETKQEFEKEEKLLEEAMNSYRTEQSDENRKQTFQKLEELGILEIFKPFEYAFLIDDKNEREKYIQNEISLSLALDDFNNNVVDPLRPSTLEKAFKPKEEWLIQHYNSVVKDSVIEKENIEEINKKKEEQKKNKNIVVPKTALELSLASERRRFLAVYVSKLKKTSEKYKELAIEKAEALGLVEYQDKIVTKEEKKRHVSLGEIDEARSSLFHRMENASSLNSESSAIKESSSAMESWRDIAEKYQGRNFDKFKEEYIEKVATLSENVFLSSIYWKKFIESSFVLNTLGIIIPEQVISVEEYWKIPKSLIETDGFFSKEKIISYLRDEDTISNETVRKILLELEIISDTDSEKIYSDQISTVSKLAEEESWSPPKSEIIGYFICIYLIKFLDKKIKKDTAEMESLYGAVFNTTDLEATLLLKRIAKSRLEEIKENATRKVIYNALDARWMGSSKDKIDNSHNSKLQLVWNQSEWNISSASGISTDDSGKLYGKEHVTVLECYRLSTKAKINFVRNSILSKFNLNNATPIDDKILEISAYDNEGYSVPPSKRRRKNLQYNWKVSLKETLSALEENKDNKLLPNQKANLMYDEKFDEVVCKELASSEYVKEIIGRSFKKSLEAQFIRYTQKTTWDNLSISKVDDAIAQNNIKNALFSGAVDAVKNPVAYKHEKKWEPLRGEMTLKGVWPPKGEETDYCRFIIVYEAVRWEMGPDNKPVKGREVKTFEIGNLQFYLEITVGGYAGASLALSSGVSIGTDSTGRNGIRGETPIKADQLKPGWRADQEENVRVAGKVSTQKAPDSLTQDALGDKAADKGLVEARINLFAGIEFGGAISGKVLWQPPEDSTQQNPADIPWLTLAEFKHELKYNVGVGLSGEFAITVFNGRFIILLAARAVFGFTGGSGKLHTEVNLKHISKLINLICSIVARADYTRVLSIQRYSIYKREDKEKLLAAVNKGVEDPYQVVCDIATAFLITGLRISQIALMGFDALNMFVKYRLKQEHAPQIARFIIQKANNDNEKWFKNLLPEVKGRIINVLLSEQDVTINDGVQGIKHIFDEKYDFTARQKLDNIYQRNAIWTLINWVTTETQTAAERQFYETLVRCNDDGTKSDDFFTQHQQFADNWQRISDFFEATQELDDTQVTNLLLSLNTDAEFGSKRKSLIETPIPGETYVDIFKGHTRSYNSSFKEDYTYFQWVAYINHKDETMVKRKQLLYTSMNKIGTDISDRKRLTLIPEYAEEIKWQ